MTVGIIKLTRNRSYIIQPRTTQTVRTEVRKPLVVDEVHESVLESRSDSGSFSQLLYKTGLSSLYSNKKSVSKSIDKSIITHSKSVCELNDFKVVNINYQNGNYRDFHSCFLKNEKGQIMENIWQSCKIYSKLNSYTYKMFETVLWEHNTEIHLENDTVTNAYYLWKDKLINNKYPVVYPCGYSNRNKFEFILFDNKKYSYNDAFYNIYIPMYLDLIKNKPRFKELQKEYRNGQNILIICDHLPSKEIDFNINNKEQFFYSPGFTLALSLSTI